MRRAPRSLLAAAMLIALPVAGTFAGTVAAGDADDLDAARAGLAAFLADHRPPSPSDSSEIAGCPAIDLGRFQTALDHAGLSDDPIMDWGTEIEWDEWTEIDAQLMSIVCAGDADGDAHDFDAQLGAAIGVIDAGTEERALEVEQMLGFGALDAEPAAVPGGQVMATCVDWEDLAVCVSVWSQEGFVVAALLRSDERDVPDGAGTAVLEDVLDDVLSTLAAYGGESAPTTDSTDESGPTTDSAISEPLDGPGVPDVDAARTGLRSLVAGSDPVHEMEPLPQCPFIGRNAVVDALEAAGVDAPVESLLLEEGPILTSIDAVAGFVCSGTYIGPGRDESFPELFVQIIVGEFRDHEGFVRALEQAHPDIDGSDVISTPSVGGATIGGCAHVDLRDDCTEFWEHSGFAIGINLADRVYMDRATASAVLAALVPSVVEVLASQPEPVAAMTFEASAEQVTAARSALAAVVEMAPDGGALESCPLLRSADAAATFADVGFDVESWTGRVSVGLDAERTIRPIGVVCEGSGAHTAANLFVHDYGSSDAAHAVIDLVEGCERGGDVVYCVVNWEQDGLAVTLTVTTRAISRAGASGLLDGLLPQIFDNLARVA